ncbi:MAG: anthranilate phosphoribosyltransferase [Mangrovibacterium sp.]|nr:anthranilate phosphoribosyltransferase [Mangrovibacterium sp.]
MKEILSYLVAKNTLDTAQAQQVFTEIAMGNYSDAEVAAFITVYLMRPITGAELTGFRQALLDLSVGLDFSDFNTIDVCGTGGDEKNTFNVSTLTAFVLAGAGVKVAKHGNYAASSACGSSNVLEHFGYRFTTDEDRLKRELDQTGICYLHAPLFHPALKKVSPVRKALKIKTFMNMLGPMVNPARPKNQMVGVYNREVMQLYHEVFRETPANYTILHSEDGYDEISLTGPFSFISNMGAGKLVPEDFCMRPLKAEDLFGGTTVDEAASIFLRVLQKKGTNAQNKVVIANAALALKTVDPAKELSRCVEEAENSLYGEKALNAFQRLVRQENHQ